MRVVLALALAGCAGNVRPSPPPDACLHEAAYGRRHRARWFLRDKPISHEELEQVLAGDPVAALDLQQAWQRDQLSSRSFRFGMGAELVGGVAGVLIAQNDTSDNRLPTFISAGVVLGTVITAAVLAIWANEDAERHRLDAVDHYNASCR